jgi:hypothetical protein
MPNWCHTDYKFEGSAREIKDLYNKLKSLEEMEKPLIKNDFGKNWLGCVVNLFGGRLEKRNCRGSFYDLKLLDDNTIHLHTETAWANMPEVWGLVLGNYESIVDYFYTEEVGECYYATNDVEGKYFPERFVVDQIGEPAEFFENKEGLYGYVSLITESHVSNKEEMDTAIESYNSENEDNEIYIKEILVLSK